MIYPILLLAIVLRLWNINQSLWLDEAAQVIESSLPALLIPQNMSAIFHPPLFHIIAHYWLFLGKEEWLVRILPVAFGIGSIYIAYLFAKELFNKKTGLIAALLLAINPFHIYYSQEFRPYIMTLFVVLVVMYLFWKSLKQGGKWWLFYSLALTALFYSTYMAVFIIVGQLIFLALTNSFIKHTKNLAISFIVSGLLFLPWMPYVFEQIKMSGSFSTDLPGWKDAVSTPVYKLIPLTLVKFIIGQINFSPPIIYGLMSGLVVLVWGCIILKGSSIKDKAWVYVSVLGISGLIIPTIFSILLQIASPKRLVFILPLVVILLAVGVNRYKYYYFKILLFILVTLNFMFLAIFNLNPKFQREDWKNAVKFVESQAGNDTLVLFKFSGPFAPYTYYGESNVPFVGLTSGSVVSQQLLEDRLAEPLINKNKIFVFQYIEGMTDPNYLTEKYLESYGFINVATYDFSGVGLIREYKIQ